MCLCSHYPETLILDIWMKRRILPHSLLTHNTSPAQTGYSHLAVLWGLEVPEAPSDLRDPQDQGALAPLWRTGKDLGVQGHPEDLWGIRGTTDQFHCQHMRSRNSFRRRVQNEKQSKWNVLRCKIIIKNTSNRILTRHTCICTSLLFHLKSQILETGTDVGVISTNRPPSSGLPDNHLWPSLEHYLLVKLILSQASCF